MLKFFPSHSHPDLEALVSFGSGEGGAGGGANSSAARMADWLPEHTVLVVKFQVRARVVLIWRRISVAAAGSFFFFDAPTGGLRRPEPYITET